ncbi:aldehyde dehydrogenase [Flammeovirga aprica]|uniref:Aldehyde dehydrogenase n=1 Tax=Flammeovirga aprica JL-4 TaxID=694437 RepID=A0A7X9RW23_9BACT|nr:aldehyde dehydrogenase [Flammeovirga aprica]NME69786.1 aldehyde dehydrogenase [Flammeovirga aprica JL-4]
MNRGIFNSPKEAIQAAKTAQLILSSKGNEEKKRYIANIRKKLLAEDVLLKMSEMAVEETGMGKVSHKIGKNHLAITKTPSLDFDTPESYVGDEGVTLVESTPYGVIGAITPVTNPSETIICNTIGMISAGNSVVFCPHGKSKNVCHYTIGLINEALVESGAPENLVVGYTEINRENTDEVIYSEDVDLLVATGGSSIVQKIMKSGKKAIGSGGGNPPVVVDETADLKHAAASIIAGASLDNNIPCIAEKELICLASVADELLEELKKAGAYILTDQNKIDELLNLVIKDDKIDPSLIGQDASVFLNKIGIEADDSVELIVFETIENNVAVQKELLMPILPLVRTETLEEAIEMAHRCEHGNHHTSVMHSKNIDNLKLMADKMQTTIFVQNAPSYAGIGLGGEGFTSFTIACPTGEGLTSYRCFSKIKRKVMCN